MGAIIFRWVSISALVVVLVWALIAASDGTESKQCGEFDTVQLGIDVRSGYFEKAGIEMAKVVISELAIQLECERGLGEN